MTPLNNVITSDLYAPATTLVAPRSTRLRLQVRNAAIYYQLGRSLPATVWDEEVFLAPGDGGFSRDFDVVRVRSAVAGTPAQVTVEGLP